MIERWIVGLKAPTDRQLFIWNMIGSGVYALASLVLTYMTIRVIGDKEGGVFAIALTLAQMFIYIAYYEMRNFQVTDAQEKYQFQEYHAVKIVNCLAMMLVTVIYCFIKQYSPYKFLVVILVCVYRMLDGYADVYEAEFHYKKRLDLAGKSLSFRTLFSVGGYFAVLIVTHNLILALLAAIVIGTLGVWIFNILTLKYIEHNGVFFEKNAFIGILKDCFPLFLGMFLWTYLLSASRIAVDDVMSSEYQSYYQVLFLPVSVINLLAGFLIRPSLINLTDLHANNQKSAFWSKIMKMLIILVVFTGACMIGAYICGIQILNVVVGCDLTKYRNLFVFLIFSGGFNAAAYLLYYVLTIYRSGISVLTGYISASVAAFVLSPYLVKKMALWGAGLSYFVSILILLVMFIGALIVLERKNKIKERRS